MHRIQKILCLLATILIILLTGTVLLLYLFSGSPIFQWIFLSSYRPIVVINNGSNPEDPEKIMANALREFRHLSQTLDAFTPTRPYLVVNTTRNRFYLYNSKNQLIREGFCSSGSYVKLKADNDREWLFKTPKGMRTIKGKTRSPVWRKPDWAFIEEGLPVPPPDHPSRFEAGVLGDYALSLGDGYLIHGTIYKRFLGMPVTHGCIRMGDDDLELVYKTLDIGSKVYIY